MVYVMYTSELIPEAKRRVEIEHLFTLMAMWCDDCKCRHTPTGCDNLGCQFCYVPMTDEAVPYTYVTFDELLACGA